MPTIIMTETVAGAALLKLTMLMSPAFPVGAFSYSHGLERAAHDGIVADAGTFGEWIEGLFRHGSAWNDAVLLAEARRRPAGELAELADLAAAMAGSAERHAETVLQGAAFCNAAAGLADMRDLPPDCPYPVAVGTVGAHLAIAPEPLVACYLQAFASNQVQAGIRLSLFGQIAGVQLMERFERPILDTARRACASTLDDLGGCALIAELCAMRHETQYSRLFRS